MLLQVLLLAHMLRHQLVLSGEFQAVLVLLLLGLLGIMIALQLLLGWLLSSSLLHLLRCLL